MAAASSAISLVISQPKCMPAPQITSFRHAIVITGVIGTDPLNTDQLIKILNAAN